MTESEFEAQLRADGYTKIEITTIAPRTPLGEHRHDHTIRGLVLAGQFIVNQPGGRQVCGPGEIFFVAQGDPHDEEIGPDGARVLIGRKFTAAA